MFRFAAALAAFLMSAIPAQACGLLEACKPVVHHVMRVRVKPTIARHDPSERRLDAIERRLEQDETILKAWVRSVAAAHSRLDAIPNN